MTDLYDRAKPARDAILAQIEASTDAQMSKSETEGANLGAHFTAVLAAFTAERHKVTVGIIDDGDLLDIVAFGLGIALANAAMVYRPVVDERPIEAMTNLIDLAQRTVIAAQQQIITFEQGLNDAVPFVFDDAAEEGAKPFDFNDYMRGGDDRSA